MSAWEKLRAAARLLDDTVPLTGHDLRLAALAYRQAELDLGGGEAFFACPKATVHQVELSYPVWIPEGIDDREAWQVDIEAQPEKTFGQCWCRACDEHVWPVRISELGS